VTAVHPSNLSFVQKSFRSEIFQCFVVGNDQEIRQAGEFCPPFLERQDDGKHLLVVDLIMSLGSSEGLRVEGDGMPLVVLGALWEITPAAARSEQSVSTLVSRSYWK